MQHHCGVVAWIAHHHHYVDRALILPALNAIQHRGYESAGIAYVTDDSDTLKLNTCKALGKADDVFANIDLPQNMVYAIGHVRYSTVAKQQDMRLQLLESQPLASQTLCLVHNGNIPQFCHAQLAVSDTLNLMHRIESLYTRLRNWPDVLINIIESIPYAYALLILTENGVYALRDRYGVRPLFVAQTSQQDYVLSSETISFDEMPVVCHDVREIRPGELLRVTRGCLTPCYQYANVTKPRFCSFELIYFMHHSSLIHGEQLDQIRYQLGYALGQQQLTKNYHAQGIVVAVPNAAIPMAKGFAAAVHLPFVAHAIERKQNATRTFILPTQQQRLQACENKFNYRADLIRNAHIYLLEDSIVRGTTLNCVVSRLRALGAASIHLRIASPVVRRECILGIDMAKRQAMISYPDRTEQSIGQRLNADSIAYLSVEDMLATFQGGDRYCTSCFCKQKAIKNDLFDW